MFDKFGQMKDLMSQANEMRKIQKKMSKMRVDSDQDGVKLSMDGPQTVKSIDIADKLLTPSEKVNLQNKIINAIEDCKTQIQKDMMSEMGMM